MRKLAILTFQTLDGVMQAPSVPEEDYSGGFTGGGWAREYWDEVMAQVQTEAMSEPYDLLLGRKTYELFAPSFANAGPENPVAQMFLNATKYVVSSTLTEFDWANSRGVTGDIPGEIRSLKSSEGPLLQVHGSWELIQLLLKHNLIDEFRIWTFPTVLGSGKKLFPDGTLPVNLKLIRRLETASGVVMSFYSRLDTGDA